MMPSIVETMKNKSQDQARPAASSVARSSQSTLADSRVRTCTVLSLVTGVLMAASAPRATAAEAPAITVHPQGQSVIASSRVEFTASATGTAPLYFEWRRDGSALQGGTETTLVLDQAWPEQNGGYTLVVTNSYGATTSQVAQLTAVVPRVLVTPTGGAVTVVQGSDATASPAGLALAPLPGTPTGYQWYRNGSALQGETRSNLLIHPVQTNHSGSYSVYVSTSGSSGTMANSATLTVRSVTAVRTEWTTPVSMLPVAAMAMDAAGCVYVTGQGQGAGIGGGDYLTVKYDRTGRLLWQAAYGGLLTDEPSDMAVDSAGNVYVTGARRFQSGFGSATYYATVKYDPNGVLLWDRLYRGSGDSYAQALAVDASGSSYVTGTAGGTEEAYATVKYGPGGEELWVALHNNNMPPDWHWIDRAYDIAVDANTNIYVSGSSDLVRYDSSGDKVWAVFMPASNSKLVIDASGAIIVGAPNTQPNATPAWPASGRVIKVDPSGAGLWGWNFDGWFAGLSLDTEQNIIFARTYDVGDLQRYRYAGVMKFDPSGTPLWSQSYAVGGAGVAGLAVDLGGNSYLSTIVGSGRGVIKWSKNGDRAWMVTANGADAGPIAVDGSFNVIQAGRLLLTKFEQHPRLHTMGWLAGPAGATRLVQPLPGSRVVRTPSLAAGLQGAVGRRLRRSQPDRDLPLRRDRGA
jgi:hypothetical protein